MPSFIKENATGNFRFTKYIDGQKTSERTSLFIVKEVRSKDFIIETPSPTGAVKSNKIFCEFPQVQAERTTENGNTKTRSSQTVSVKENGYTRTVIDVYISEGQPSRMFTLEAEYTFDNQEPPELPCHVCGVLIDKDELDENGAYSYPDNLPHCPEHYDEEPGT